MPATLTGEVDSRRCMHCLRRHRYRPVPSSRALPPIRRCIERVGETAEETPGHEEEVEGLAESRQFRLQSQRSAGTAGALTEPDWLGLTDERAEVVGETILEDYVETK